MKAVIYTRFSPRPNAHNCQSCEFQFDAGKQFCDLHGHEIIARLDDEGLSGSKTDNRPGFQKAMELACKHKAALVVHSLSRFARSTKDAIENAERLNKAGANLVSLKENIDTTTAMGRFVFTIFAALDELERQRIAERTKESMLKHMANNRKISSKPPYGYCFDPDDSNKIIINSIEQRIIRIIKILRNKNHSYRGIAKMLNEKLYPSRGKRWHHHTIKRILERYKNN